MHLVLSNNIQTTLAVGLGICQGELKKKKKIFEKILSAFFRTAPVMEEPDTVLLQSTRVPKTTNVAPKKTEKKNHS